ncbi:MAG TPA: AMP-binding protein [Blastocatellia bacterium]|jgi:acyl-coenzyme A synthetase/AMP-(fatty) acid ligase|nr:AMP-binding protein [Blastocatellia bacterium]
MRGLYLANSWRSKSGERARAEFRLVAPFGVDVARKVCDGGPNSAIRPAIIEARPAGENIYTFGALDYLSDKLARVLRGSGVGGGDRVVMMLCHSAAVVVAHAATWKTGAMVVPFALRSYSRPAVELIELASPRAAILQDTADPNLIHSIKKLCPNTFIVSDEVHGFVPGEGERSFWREIYESSSDFEQVAGSGESHAFLFRVKYANGKLGATRGRRRSGPGPGSHPNS